MRPLPENYLCKVAIIGLGYVGLPLAIEIAKNKTCHRQRISCNRKVLGFDINHERLEELSKGFDRTNELSKNDFKTINSLKLSDDPNSLVDNDVFIITVPTPINEFNKPDLKALSNASKLVGQSIKKRFALNDKKSMPIVIYESTVYPGLIEEICIPIIQSELGFKYSNEFSYGYSPERINPGDKSKRLSDIVKITSGKDELTANWIDDFYGSFIIAGTHKAESIKVAEAAKVIENTQRDINIALVNELAIICKSLEIDTLDVLKAANTKWNFHDFKPGLVGGHCIGVDPYYLTYKAELLGYRPEVVLAGRKMNDSIGSWLVNELIKSLKNEYKSLLEMKILVLGITFKENCPDVRNSGVMQIIKSLEIYGIKPLVVDPFADIHDCKRSFNINILRDIPKKKKFNAVIAAVAHNKFKDLSCAEWIDLLEENGKFLDVKGIIPRAIKAIRL